MPESEFSQQNLASVLTRLGNVESMLRFTVAASADVKDHVKQALQDRDGAAEVYLLLKDGPKTQSQIKDATGKSQGTASRILGYLTSCGLIARDPNPVDKGFVWRWSDVEEIVRVSKIAEIIVRDAKKSKD
jgi:predicted transcriptional regulator